MESKIFRATRWSVVSEIIAKIISPITTMLLARVLSQEVFGIVASITVVTSMADMLTDAGFNAYILQHQFASKEEERKTIDVCFWSNAGLSVFLYFIIVVFSSQFAAFVGAPGYSSALIVASLVLPLTSFSSVSITVLRKRMDFKRVGIIRVVSKALPLVVTLPLALLGIGYWALIIGMLAGEAVNAILGLTLGGYVPRAFYRFSILKSVLGFSSWTFAETILEWLLANIAIMAVSKIFGLTYSGVFKTSITIVTQITASVYALYSNVYKASMSLAQNDEVEFERLFRTFQKYASMLMLPLGIGVLLMRDFVVYILLGSNWDNAATLVGLWGLASSLSVGFGAFYSDAIRAKGLPKFLVIIDSIYLAFLLGLLAFANTMSFYSFSIWYCLLKLIQPVLQMIYGQKICHVRITEVIKTCRPQIFASLIMAIPIILANTVFNLPYTAVIGNFVLVALCVLIYGICLLLFTPDKAAAKRWLGEMVKRKR